MTMAPYDVVMCGQHWREQQSWRHRFLADSSGGSQNEHNEPKNPSIWTPTMQFVDKNSKVSKNIRNQGETLFWWAFAISTWLRQSLNLSIENHFNSQQKNIALNKLNSGDFHRQLRNELIMIPIPKMLSTEYNQEAPLSQAHFLFMALERVSF